MFFRRCFNWRLESAVGGVGAINKADIVGSVATTPIRMIIQGYGSPKGAQRNLITVLFRIIQSENPIIFETDPKDVDADVFHEAYRTFNITGGYHQGNISNQTAGRTKGAGAGGGIKNRCNAWGEIRERMIESR